MNLRYRNQYLNCRYHINRKNIPYYYFCVYGLTEGFYFFDINFPIGFEGNKRFGISFIDQGFKNMQLGIKIKML